MSQQLADKKFEGGGALGPFLRQIFSYSFRYKRWFFPLAGMAIVVALVDAFFPYIWSLYLDEAIAPAVENFQKTGELQTDYSKLYSFGYTYLAFLITQVTGVFVFIWYAGKIRHTVIYDLRKEMFEKLQKLSFSYYDRSAIGWLISRITSDTDRVTEVISWGTLDLVWGVFTILSCFGIMAFYNWKLMLIVLFSMPVLALLSVHMRRKILAYSREARRINSEMTAYFNEHVHGIEVNKVSAQEDNAALGYSEKSQKMRRASYRAAFFSAMLAPLVMVIGASVAGLIIFFGGQSVLTDNGLTIGMLAAFISYATLVYGPIHELTNFYASAQGAVSAGERVFSLLREPVEMADEPGMPDFDDITGEVQFSNVDFHYVADQKVLKNFNLHIRPGESIALVGPTGEGKSTIASLIARFYQPRGGEILIDGVDYRRRTLHSLRRQMGIILQTPHVFSGTILDNIRYGDFDATEARVAETLRIIGADELISRLNEQVGESGGNLSSGEKQLISFARVIVKNPKILIMDEATSSVDTLAEAKIQIGIEQLISGRTSIIIAHRLSTIRNCDRILVIRAGEIIEAGSHPELVAQKGQYYRLYTHQSREALPS